MHETRRTGANRRRRHSSKRGCRYRKTVALTVKSTDRRPTYGPSRPGAELHPVAGAARSLNGEGPSFRSVPRYLSIRIFFGSSDYDRKTMIFFYTQLFTHLLIPNF